MLSLTPQSQTCSKMSVFRAFVFVTSFNSIFWKTSEIKKIPWTICDLRYYFHFNIFRHHREKKCVKLRIKTDTGYDAHHGVRLRSMMYTVKLDSAVGCTPQSFWDILFAWLCGVIHTAELESDSTLWCTPWSLSLWYDESAVGNISESAGWAGLIFCVSI